MNLLSIFLLFWQLPTIASPMCRPQPEALAPYSGNYSSHHYQLAQSWASVQQLKVSWMYQTRGREHFETMPLSLTAPCHPDPPSDVTALDLRTMPIWHYRVPHRGVFSLLRTGESREYSAGRQIFMARLTRMWLLSMRRRAA